MARLTGPRRSVAVVGSGISGLTAAYLLRRRYDVTLYEADDRFGGHAHTHDLDGDLVDSGFAFHHDRANPILRRLLDQLDLSTSATAMSVSVRCDGCGLEYADGLGQRGLHAQRRRAFDPRFSRLVAEIPRFRATGLEVAKSLDPAAQELTYGQFLAERDFDEHFVRHHAVPLAAGAWTSGSTPATTLPAKHVLGLLRHQGLLGRGPGRAWLTVDGGTRSYVDAVTALIRESLAHTPVTAIARTSEGVEITTARRTDRFDHVVVATHADEALRLLTDPTADESAVLGAFEYARTEVTVHCDLGVLPRSPRARAVLNHRLADCDGGGRPTVVSTQVGHVPQSGATTHVVTRDAGALREAIAEPTVVARIDYAHPTFSAAATSARKRLTLLTTDRTVFAGAYHGTGSHEDGCRSGVAAAAHLGAEW